MIPARTNLFVLARHPSIFTRRYRCALLILLVGALADAITTWRSVKLFGPEVEVHPVQRLMFEMCGANLGVPLSKLIQVAVVVFVAAWWRPWCGWLMLACGGLYSLAAVSNWFHLI